MGNEGHIAEWPLESLQGKTQTQVQVHTQKKRCGEGKRKECVGIYHAFLLGERDIVVIVVLVVAAVAVIHFIVVGIVFETFLAAITDNLLVGIVISIWKVDRFGMFSPCC